MEVETISKELSKDDVSLLAEAGYSRKAIEIYGSRVNVDVMENLDVDLAYTGPCGDTIKLYLKISAADVIEDATFQYLGCPASAICGSTLTQIVKGKTLQEAKTVTEGNVLEDLGGLPGEECHCAELAVTALHKTISKYEEKKQIGTIKKGVTQGVNLVYGELNVGEPMAVPLIREVRKQTENGKTVLIDVPPGTACPLVASVYKSDYCILVTEPTPFGLHDLKITVEVLTELRIPLGVIMNRAGIGDQQVYEYCKSENIPLLLEIPFSRKIAELYSRGVPFVSEMPEWKLKFRQLFDEIGRGR